MPRAPRMKCAFAEPDVPKIKKARAAPVKSTPEEKEEKKALAKARAAVREKKKQWEATLKPWVSRESRGVQFALGTKAQFRSDAKKAFRVTDAELETIPFMGFASSKIIYRLTDCKQLADRKRAALGSDAFDYPARAIMECTDPKERILLYASGYGTIMGDPDHTVTVEGTSLRSLSGRRAVQRPY
ncbi:hypothetical protein EVJ58_g8406 [Rhodofomes roseus]|uniref:Uncharacterized protein n=1 Tax=Rhodofomes roseus TaxID=34475 RepID=A0A4Y9Y0T2_9APHY|nr:hypothetical protein EVJ58_g8406 [Rhodofomes roseus]